MLAVILQMNLFDAIPYSDPFVALQAARDGAPDFLISDIAMPGINGIDLAIAIQVEAPRCKVLLFSGQVGAPELIERAAEAGHRFEMVEKPIQPAKMVAALRSL